MLCCAAHYVSPQGSKPSHDRGLALQVAACWVSAVRCALCTTDCWAPAPGGVFRAACGAPAPTAWGRVTHIRTVLCCEPAVESSSCRASVVCMTTRAQNHPQYGRAHWLGSFFFNVGSRAVLAPDARAMGGRSRRHPRWLPLQQGGRAGGHRVPWPPPQRSATTGTVPCCEAPPHGTAQRRGVSSGGKPPHMYLFIYVWIAGDVLHQHQRVQGSCSVLRWTRWTALWAFTLQLRQPPPGWMDVLSPAAPLRSGASWAAWAPLDRSRPSDARVQGPCAERAPWWCPPT